MFSRFNYRQLLLLGQVCYTAHIVVAHVQHRYPEVLVITKHLCHSSSTSDKAAIN